MIRISPGNKERRGSYSSFLPLSLLLSMGALIPVITTHASEWETFAQTKSNTFYYEKGYARPEGNIIVRVRILPREDTAEGNKERQSIINKLTSDGVKDANKFAFSEREEVIDCQTNRYYFRRTKYFDGGSVKFAEDEGGVRWRSIKPETPIGKLKTIVCK
jgi:hypothetical protein